MTTPREPDRFDAQARELRRTGGGWNTELVAAALRAEHASALERAARNFEQRILSGAFSRFEVAAALRAMIPPAAAPAADYDPITAPIPEGDMNGPHGPVCGCGKPSRYESGWCGETNCFNPQPAADPLTSGQRAQVSLAEHRLRLKALFEENERRPLPDTALRAVLLDADRFVDEFCAPATVPVAPAAETCWKCDAPIREPRVCDYCQADLTAARAAPPKEPPAP